MKETPAETNVLQTPDETNVLQTPDETNVLQTPAETNVLQTPAEINMLQTPAETNVLQTQNTDSVESLLNPSNEKSKTLSSSTATTKTAKASCGMNTNHEQNQTIHRATTHKQRKMIEMKCTCTSFVRLLSLGESRPRTWHDAAPPLVSR